MNTVIPKVILLAFVLGMCTLAGAQQVSGPDTLINQTDSSGLKQGTWIEKYADKSSKGEYVDGLREGIWITRQEDGMLSEISIFKNGKKDGVATYNLTIPVGDDDVVVFKDVVGLFENPVHGAFTRTISLALRHGVPVSYICEQVRKDKHSDMQSFSTVLSRVLKNYIEDGTKSASDKTCGSCGAENSLIYKEGCVTCASCGWSRC